VLQSGRNLAWDREVWQSAGSTVVEVKGSHAVYVSHPDSVASLIEKAAAGVPATNMATK
jgi:hypothetical protein